MNKYKPSHYIGDEKTRYILGQIGDNNVLFIGVNPSTANDIKSDTTISKIINFTKINNYSGWFIANIYPQRATDPKNLDIFPDEILLKKNIKNIKEFVGIHKIKAVIACWGNLITTRLYLKNALDNLIHEANLNKLPWFCIGLTKNGIPLHPSRAKYGKFVSFSLYSKKVLV